MAYPILYQKIKTWLSEKANTSDVYTKAEVDSKVSTSESTLSTKVDELKSSLAEVATSGSYTDLINLPQLGALASKDSVSFSELTGTEKVRTTDTKLTLNDFSDIDLGMVGE